MVEANIAVLIDFENVGLDNMQRLLDQLAAHLEHKKKEPRRFLC